MKPDTGQFEQLASLRDSCYRYQPDPARVKRELERVELLVPELPHTTGHDLQSYALAYVERYQNDLLQLEHEWEFLYAALIQAWQQAEYSAVVRLAIPLAHSVGRLSNPAVAQHILGIGIEASRRAEDMEHLASFLNRLGGLLFCGGEYRRGRRIWYAGLELASSCGSSSGLWEPLSTFAQIADVLGDYPSAQHFADTFLHSRRNDNPDAMAVAIFIRGFYAHVTNDPERAIEDLSCSLRLLSQQAPSAPPTSYRQLFTIAVQAELARVQGDYTGSKVYAESALSLAQLFSDHYTAVDLLIDDALFTDRNEQFRDVRVILQRLRTLSCQSEDPRSHERCHFIAQRLAKHLPQRYSNQDRAFHAESAELHEPLSEREVEVLQLVAAGFANQEIARQLVITPGTVKKHLEHIYTKLDVPSRTSAIAKARALNIFP